MTTKNKVPQKQYGLDCMMLVLERDGEQIIFAVPELNEHFDIVMALKEQGYTERRITLKQYCEERDE